MSKIAYFDRLLAASPDDGKDAFTEVIESIRRVARRELVNIDKRNDAADQMFNLLVMDAVTESEILLGYRSSDWVLDSETGVLYVTFNCKVSNVWPHLFPAGHDQDLEAE